jgi:hypothetical protein
VLEPRVLTEKQGGPFRCVRGGLFVFCQESAQVPFGGVLRRFAAVYWSRPSRNTERTLGENVKTRSYASCGKWLRASGVGIGLLFQWASSLMPG